MSIPSDSPWRGAAAFFRQPVNRTEELAAQSLEEAIYKYNVRCSISTNLPDIEYRSSDGEIDTMRHVFRWDKAPYDFIFQNGFEARRQEDTPDETYFNLERYVTSGVGGRPLDTRRDTTHAFISTSLSSSWYPSVNYGSAELLYRYEIYAPGGIWVSQTLGNSYPNGAQDEVAFPAGIAPQYIRSAQLFELTNDRENTKRRRVNSILYINLNFNPQSHPERRLKIQSPVVDYMDENKQRRKLEIQKVPDQGKQSAVDTTSEELSEYYAEGVADADNYIDSAFRSTRKNEAYVFIKEESLLMNYAPATRDDKIISGLKHTGNRFCSLAGTAFAEHGVDAAFGCHDHDGLFSAKSEAMIFSANLCARINFAPRTGRDWIMEGPKTIRQMFPFFKGTSFEKGVDAAFESSVARQAYLFKGHEYAVIDYSKEPKLVARRPITEGFMCFGSGHLFARDIGAAMASHVPKEAYLFKENNYVLFHFTPGEAKDYIIGGPKEIVPRNWPCLKGILPRKNKALDLYDDSTPRSNPARDQDQ
ncbi:hypothetical protein U9M48_020779 [Paspalum notatum var. saurae]|uniref:Pierisin-like domain-containing protein n=1 Tax=Paspalum notatum var. saurae TaxID=547442 RepID=A0AAQ3TI63_PASNO